MTEQHRGNIYDTGSIAQAHDRAAQARLKALDETLQRLKAEQAELTEQWQREKEEMQRLQSIKNEIERVNLEIQARAAFALHTKLPCIGFPALQMWSSKGMQG